MKFLSNEGLVFSSCEDCRRHEDDPSFIMYDTNGRTYDCDNALVVVIRRPEGAELFSILCGQNDSVGDGADAVGVFIWSDSEEQYIEVDLDILSILKDL